ncbi:peptide chain release factor N(5)-glutamine methyltransferase [Gordonia sp. NB41Y]|uniref:peptide chain release factor N(5)-glutamine methyltransferase n=1 Tax=Gordonia sp. NB41Y TaxID=875808 RepID=UPI0006B14DDD|nr:peptide chain release factor N(5)-glutamine methyltransferase [Gordonia sp. NB41Y]EMP10683.2 modification methylase HemK [Gordonia sp. NB41Y]WLP91423.1 peptide chain release factor N(5)-glutamine methyltransferase [Gordonia sp. NB41Y]
MNPGTGDAGRQPVRLALAEATGVLAAAGVDSPRADAEWLLVHVLGTDRGRLLVADDLDHEARGRFAGLIALRAQRIPMQHLVGTAAFGPVELHVGPGVFVPRPETELLYAWAHQLAERELAGAAAQFTVVDLCSGSGALAIALAATLPGARVHAVEKSPEATTWLQRNVDGLAADVAARVAVHTGDVTDAGAVAAMVGAPADLVVSNPPYVPSTTPVPAEVYADPAMAVFGGEDGMDVITPMAATIAAILRPGGCVGIEHDDTTADAVTGLLHGTGDFDEVTSHTDLAGRPRFVTARRRGR